MGIFNKIDAPYTPFESWFYDTVIASRLDNMFKEITEDLEPELKRLENGVKVLDVGCGGGHLILKLAPQFPNLKFRGIDFSPEQIARAQKRAQSFGQQVIFYKGSALDLRFDDNSFDCVFSTGSIKHWPSPAAGLSECVRILRPGRKILIAEAYGEISHEDFVANLRHFKLPFLLQTLMSTVIYKSVFARSLKSSDLASLMERLPLQEINIHKSKNLPIMVATAVKVS